MAKGYFWGPDIIGGGNHKEIWCCGRGWMTGNIILSYGCYPWQKNIKEWEDFNDVTYRVKGGSEVNF